MTATYETNAGSSFRATLRLKYMATEVARLKNRANYAHIALFIKPGPNTWRWDPAATNWANSHQLDVSQIKITPDRQKITDDNQEISVQIEVPAVFGMTELIPAGANDKLTLTLAAAYVSAKEVTKGNGPPGRTWDVAQITVNRRASVALLAGTDGSSPGPNDQYFTSARTVFKQWMRVIDSPDVRDLRGAIAWLHDNVRRSGLPWGMVHLVSHSDGHVWLLRRCPIEEWPTFAGYAELEPGNVRQVADELVRKNIQPLAEHVASDSHVVIHACNFARDDKNLLLAAQTLFAASPRVHGPKLFVNFGRVDSGPVPAAGAVESLAAFTSGKYVTREISPNPLTSVNFVHI